jgi:3',5'-cyclic AMP phosphodiesterase CpdA
LPPPGQAYDRTTFEFRLTQISDTHLGRRFPGLIANFNRVSEHIDASMPDLVVNTGDVSFDGPTGRDDVQFAKSLHAALPVACRYIPGNHDIGDNPTAIDPAQADVSQRARRPRDAGDLDPLRAAAGTRAADRDVCACRPAPDRQRSRAPAARLRLAPHPPRLGAVSRLQDQRRAPGPDRNQGGRARGVPLPARQLCEVRHVRAAGQVDVDIEELFAQMGGEH